MFFFDFADCHDLISVTVILWTIFAEKCIIGPKKTQLIPYFKIIDPT